MCTPQECSICWAACEKYYSTAVVFFFWGGGRGWSVHVKTTERCLSFESSLRECYTAYSVSTCMHVLHVYVLHVLTCMCMSMQYFVCACMHGICLLREYS